MFSIFSVTCDIPLSLLSGEFTLTSDGIVTSVTFTCDQGHTLKGTSAASCSSAGLWSEPQPECGKYNRQTFI